MKAEEALAKLVAGVGKFQREVFPSQRKTFEQLKHSQHPMAMFFTCADSRIVPNELLQSGPGDVFTERTPGNIVPRYTDHVGGVTASLEYAVKVLHVPLIIICGHMDCGVMKALLDPGQTSGMPALQTWMRHSLAARDRLLRDAPKLAGEEQLRRVTEYNVLTQLENARTHPAVEEALATGVLQISGWVYDIGAGAVSIADEQTGEFRALTAAG